TATQAKPGAKCTLEGNLVYTETTTTIDFLVDTFVPEITLAPLFDGVIESDGKNDFRDYHVFRYNNTYYTNREHLFITGIMSNQSKTSEVRFFAGQTDADLGESVYVYDVAANNALDGTGLLSGFALNQPATAGSDTIVLNAAPGAIFMDKFLYLGHERVAYERYHDFYKVKSVSGSTVTLAEPLEQEVPSFFVPNVFDKPHPYNWFGANVSLALGANRFAARGRSLSGVESSTPIFDVVLDVYPPEVIVSAPRQGSRNLPVDAISFRVREAKGTAMLDTSSVRLTINEENVPITITSEDTGLYLVYNITHRPLTPLIDGTFDIALSGRDRAGNELVDAGGMKSFSFTIDDGFPLPPSWKIRDATLYEGIWYTNHSPDFVINFTANDLPVFISGLFLQLHGTSSQYEILVDCTQTTPNLFDCHPEEPLEINRAYEIVVEAHKEYPETTGPTGAYYSEPVVLDNIRPYLVFVMYKDPTVERAPLPIQVAIPNERFPLRAQWHYLGDGVIYNLNMTGNDRRGNYVFTWEVPDYSISTHAHVMNPNIVVLSISDYANNGPVAWNGTIRIDLVPPNLAGFTFTPQVEYANPTTREYYTRQLAVNITGSFTDNDVAAISVVPGNWFISQEQRQPIAFANILPDKTFKMELMIEGEFNETREMNYTVVVEDEAGNKVSVPFKLYADLKPPTEPVIIFT
ncbi:hypothetical protein HY488_01735, partial [Candidatus Woesearchaeota archaeon]|nr:hypothetical protein [Candidatus Woesearchaeota archaeon]